MAIDPFTAGAIGAGLGVIGGMSKDKQGGYQQSDSVGDVTLKDASTLNRGRSGLEGLADTGSMDLFKSLQMLLSQGPGQAEVTSNTLFQNDFANTLNNLFKTGGVPNTEQVGQANDYASKIFAPRQESLDQGFEDAEIQSQRLASRLGRPGNDPILRNKLFQEQGRQQRSLDAEKSAFSADYAEKIPQNMLQFGTALSNLKQGLASQAFANRTALLTMGQQITSAERNYRLATAKRKNSSYSNFENFSGGNVGTAIGGGFAGAGTALDALAKFQK